MHNPLLTGGFVPMTARATPALTGCAALCRVRGLLLPFSLLLAGSLLASCALAPTPSGKSASKEYFSEKEYGVSASERVVALDEEVPKGGGRYHVGKPYKVKGKVYRPKEDPDYSAVGLASWYGGAFHGRKTANGEIYDMGELTAAHPTLPLPSYARVTNLDNSRSVVVRINDRGPFKKGRIIDVSATVAEMLAFKRAGTARVKVDYVGRARMDGLDRQMLVSSYKGPQDFGSDTLFAAKVTPQPRNVVLASFTPRPTTTADMVDPSVELFGAQPIAAPSVAAPAFVPPTVTGSDPLGPLILRTGFTTSYAPTDRGEPAHRAAMQLASGGTTAAIVQLGTFSHRSNVERIAAQFSTFGKVETREAEAAGRRLYMVRVIVAGPGVATDNVVAAARSAGLTDAFVVSR